MWLAARCTGRTRRWLGFSAPTWTVPISKTLVTRHWTSPRRLALDMVRRQDILDLIGGDKIRRTNLDGSNIKDPRYHRRLDEVGILPNTLPLDVAGGKMYWTGSRGIRGRTEWPAGISRANLDGSNIEDPRYWIGLSISASRLIPTREQRGATVTARTGRCSQGDPLWGRMTWLRTYSADLHFSERLPCRGGRCDIGDGRGRLVGDRRQRLLDFSGLFVRWCRGNQRCLECRDRLHSPIPLTGDPVILFG